MGPTSVKAWALRPSELKPLSRASGGRHPVDIACEAMWGAIRGDIPVLAAAPARLDPRMEASELDAKTLALFPAVEMPEVVAAADLAADDRLVTPHADGLRIWDIRTGTLRAHLVPPLAPDGACWCGDVLLTWDRTGALVGAAGC